MTVKLEGYRDVSFNNDKGETITGTSLWLSWALTGEGASGNEVDKFFISSNGAVQLPALKVGQAYTAGFNNKGKLQSLTAKSSIQAAANPA